MSQRRRVPCRFFRQGKCNRGDNCRFLHDAEATQETPKTGREVFEDWKRAHEVLTSTSWTPSGSGSTQPERRLEKSGTNEEHRRPTATEPRHVPPAQDRHVPPAQDRHVPPTQDRVMGGCMSVRFGAGLEILSIASTDITSSSAFIENLPRDTDVGQVQQLISEFKRNVPPHAIRVNSKENNSRAIVHFDDLRVAEAAIKALDGRSYLGKPLVAGALKPTAVAEDQTVITLSWSVPSKAAVLYFRSADSYSAASSKAKENDIRGRAIKVISHPAKPSSPHPYSMMLVGLDVATTEGDLLAKFGPDKIRVLPPKSELSEEDVTVYFRSLFDDVPIKSFKVLPNNSSHRKAVVLLDSAEHARSSFKKLDGMKHDFLGNMKFERSLAYSASFRVPSHIYQAIKEEVELLQRIERDKASERHDGRAARNEKGGLDDTPALIKILDKHAHKPVTIHVNGRGRPAVVRVKAVLQKLLRGEIVCNDDGQAIWDPALRGEDGKRIVRDVAKQAAVHVFCDHRNRCLILHGSEKSRAMAKELLVEQYQLLLNMQHEISLEGFRDSGGIIAVEEHLGNEKVLFDAASRKLLVRCSPAELTKVKHILYRRARKEGPAEADDCPVCLSPAESPVQAPCGHVYCKSCALDFLKSTSDTRTFPIRCVGVGDAQCGVALTLHFIWTVVSKNEMDQLFEHSFVTYIQGRPTEYHFCPTPDCNTVYSITAHGKVVTCSECFMGICTTCKIHAHEGQSCEEYRIATDPVYAERQFEEYIKKAGAKKCPSCGSTIEKDGGCNHMTCRACQTHMCWTCLRVFEEAEAVYNHQTSCPGERGEEEEEEEEEEDMAPERHVEPEMRVELERRTGLGRMDDDDIRIQLGIMALRRQIMEEQRRREVLEEQRRREQQPRRRGGCEIM